MVRKIRGRLFRDIRGAKYIVPFHNIHDFPQRLVIIQVQLADPFFVLLPLPTCRQGTSFHCRGWAQLRWIFC